MSQELVFHPSENKLVQQLQILSDIAALKELDDARDFLDKITGNIPKAHDWIKAYREKHDVGLYTAKDEYAKRFCNSLWDLK